MKGSHDGSLGPRPPQQHGVKKPPPPAKVGAKQAGGS